MKPVVNLRKLLFIIFIGIIAFSLIGYIFAKVFPREKDPVSLLKNTTVSTTTVSNSGNMTASKLVYDEDQSQYKSAYLTEYAYADIKPKVAKISKDGWNLLFLSKNYILPDNYKITLDKIAGSSIELDARVAQYYNTMYLSAAKDQVTLTPISGYKTMAAQRRSFENKVADLMAADNALNQREATMLAVKYVSVPGTSDHNAGLSVCIGKEDSAFATSAEYKWLEKNAADYGFILRYPKDKEKVTGVLYKPYDWRFVGFAAAKEMKNSNMCLEEYLGITSDKK